MSIPKITLICRLRNEELILPDFLNHINKFIDEAYYFDDCSDDNSVDILRAHPKTKKVIRNYFHNTNQTYVQTSQRHMLLEEAKAHSKNEWFMLIEPDERIDFDFSKMPDNKEIGGIYFQLFDAYITKDDQAPYQGEGLWGFRKYFGPEYREICFLFRKDMAQFDIAIPACRQPNISGEKIVSGLVQHYGKAISIEQWEETCRYYAISVPILAEKWKKRKGKAIHTKSDFDRELLTWEQIKAPNTKLTKI